ncbi:LrgB family protein [Sporosarcina sp. ACRSM]|uniref:LrgB family protein n=1 Tax=Sporosarcina sp. ACRSM TaxID=2918216 RepID=UPI001EF50043|nr:LrgB family protein [Sporosarcina sp. ACRSM]MCG7333830.1 LrgB family protein [Sporosarcina sp. ACRSM]
MQMIGISLGFVLMTVVFYLVTNALYFKYRRAFLVPAFASSFLIILILLMFRIPYDTYMLGGQWIERFLGPAIVALAIPLYKQRDLLRLHVLPVLGGIALGVFTGLFSGALFAQLFGFSQEIILTLLPKSITTPVAMEIAAGIGGIAPLSAVFVMIAGFTGVLFGPVFLRWTRIDTPLGRGLGLGTSAHALGTSKALELGEQEASMSSVAMTLSALFGSVMAPIVVWLFY